MAKPDSRQLLIERRKALRFPSNLHATCHAGGGKTGVHWSAVVRNISPLGAGLVLRRPFSEGTQFTVRLLRNDFPVRMSVVRVLSCYADGDGYYHGCAFLQPLTETEVEELAK